MQDGLIVFAEEALPNQADRNDRRAQFLANG